jgi:hypothetical protein
MLHGMSAARTPPPSADPALVGPGSYGELARMHGERSRLAALGTVDAVLEAALSAPLDDRAEIVGR